MANLLISFSLNYVHSWSVIKTSPVPYIGNSTFFFLNHPLTYIRLHCHSWSAFVSWKVALILLSYTNTLSSVLCLKSGSCTIIILVIFIMTRVVFWSVSVLLQLLKMMTVHFTLFSFVCVRLCALFTFWVNIHSQY